jgi:hypothetical protein
MSFTLIKGTFHVLGYSPDGDSIRFKAKDASLWKKLSGPTVEMNARGHAQLRIEAVDRKMQGANSGLQAGVSP